MSLQAIAKTGALVRTENACIAHVHRLMEQRESLRRLARHCREVTKGRCVSREICGSPANAKLLLRYNREDLCAWLETLRQMRGWAGRQQLQLCLNNGGIEDQKKSVDRAEEKSSSNQPTEPIRADSILGTEPCAFGHPCDCGRC